MARTRLFLVLASARWEQGWYNGDEVVRAISLCRSGEGRTLLVVDLERAPLATHALPYGTAHLQPLHLGGLAPRDAALAVVGAVREALSAPS